ncbi:hypothetical protein BKA67DRAFT_566612 [Truncatella angustata]|uniref:Uncharacterized protein n=1 Tax=Truncatella angustata TaxID=152316 RepID=A0A9P8ZY95_9PEZI|nr:uncharacterized protein BKA67DRAFT_566612 [Truncatella angustata]KAH6654918.1 hypothetical protein BKA67DRAFT_566612 [Truncatella angustata]
MDSELDKILGILLEGHEKGQDFSPKKKAFALGLYYGGQSQHRVARRFKTGRSSIQRWVKQL